MPAPGAKAVHVYVDPVRGRLSLPGGPSALSRIEVSYAYGFSADIGGGPYPRPGSVLDLPKPI